MKNYFLRPNELENDLQSLSPSQRTAFATVMAERLLPIYDEFYQEFHWGDPRLCRDAIAVLWDYVRSESLEENRVTELKDACLAATPDMDEFAADGRVLQACSAIVSALRSTDDTTTRCAMDAGLAVQEAAADYDDVDLGLSDFKLRVSEGSSLQRELQIQEALINELRGHDQFDGRTIDNLRRRFVFGNHS